MAKSRKSRKNTAQAAKIFGIAAAVGMAAGSIPEAKSQSVIDTTTGITTGLETDLGFPGPFAPLEGSQGNFEVISNESSFTVQENGSVLITDAVGDGSGGNLIVDGSVSAGNFTGALTGDVTGNVTGDLAGV